MISHLHIENMAVIEKCDISFENGFAALTGETGAGKSILLNSIRMILGERVSRDVIRSGCEKAVITACFCALSPGVTGCLRELGLEPEDGQLLLRREIFADGRSQARLNGVPLPIALLRQVGGLLVDLHGQHDTRSLMDPALHVTYLDHFAGTGPLLEEYRRCLSKLREVRRESERIQTDEAEKQYRTEYLQFLVNEIEEAELSAEEEERLRRRKTVLVNSEKILRSVAACREALAGDEGARDRVAVALDALGEAAEFSPELGEMYDRLSELSDGLEELARDLSDEEVDGFDPAELENIEERLDLYYRLKQKYGGSVEEVLRRGQAARKELDQIIHADERLAELEQQARTLELELTDRAERLTAARREASGRLETEIEAQMRFLDMPGAVFRVQMQPCSPGDNGAEQVTFLLSANAGEAVRPLAKIASGGELSRIMLSMKAVLTADNEAQTVVFDEIDAGVSGKAAEKIAIRLRALADTKQVLAVTHLAQIAAYATQHFRIEKKERDGRTFTFVAPLDFGGRREELARIMGGMTPGEATYQAAEELLRAAENRKKERNLEHAKP